MWFRERARTTLQLASLPTWPQPRQETPTEWLPLLGNPVSSTTQAEVEAQGETNGLRPGAEVGHSRTLQETTGCKEKGEMSAPFVVQ